jgi:hypothetical protein
MSAASGRSASVVGVECRTACTGLIDHFLDSIRLGSKRIHAEMDEIDTPRGEP